MSYLLLDNTSLPQPPVVVQSHPRSLLGCGHIFMITSLLILIGFGYCTARVATGVLGGSKTKITHDLVIEQVKAVAKLVTSEARVRDVVMYENTWYGSTKRSIVVVTGRLLAGLDLRQNTQVSINHAEKRISIKLPRAKLLAVEIQDIHTYDERGGLWNPFTRQDRDAIHASARKQLITAGQNLDLLRHAEQSAVSLLGLLLAKDGYKVDVTLR